MQEYQFPDESLPNMFRTVAKYENTYVGLPGTWTPVESSASSEYPISYADFSYWGEDDSYTILNSP